MFQSEIGMKKVPITTFIGSWVEADARLAEKCREEDCEYHSDSAYKGYAVGFDDGVNTQIVDEDAIRKQMITKRDIANGFKELNIADCKRYVSEDDCLNYISSSEAYWFFAGAMWLIEQLNNKTNED